ncbi:hypothetical protein [Demequina globuliformis]|uniref:hypothetical protein n=1 Tax=Demequina globuliformis TaxID=676202 RepID=UPI0007844179|nr:hypothetical protein [Demequina globuliformis]
MERTEESVDEFLRAHDIDGSLSLLDSALREELPDASRALWRGVFWGGTEQAIIGYGDIVQPRPRGKDVEWFLIGLARQKDYVSLYVNAAEGGQYLAKVYGKDMGASKVGSASISFRAADGLDFTVLRVMVRHAARIQAYR